MQFHILNQNLENSLKKIDVESLKNMKINIEELFSLELSEFIEYNSCIFLKHLVNINRIKKQYSDDNIDRAWVEYFENSICVNDFLKNKNNNRIYLLPLSLIIFEIVKSKLKDTFPEEQFTLILSYTLLKPLGELLRGCKIYFYKKRDNESEVIDLELDNFKENAVGVYFINRK